MIEAKQDNKQACICGSESVLDITPKDGFYRANVPGTVTAPFRVGQCEACGLMRQIELPFETEAEFVEFYQNEYPPTTNAYDVKTCETDRALAEQRFEAYGLSLTPSCRILDVGSGSGAFVEVCREKGHEAFGCEIGKYAYSGKGADEFTYRDRVEDIHFPTDHFDMVTAHDVIEHVLDPRRFLEELFRFTKQEGAVLIELPRFHHEAGQHHWKIEHLWFWTQDQFRALAKEIGFAFESSTHPVASKIVLKFRKPKQKRTTILLPPGMGDTFWPVAKLEAFIKDKGCGLPDVHVVGNPDAYNGHKRAFPFLEMFPFLYSTGEAFPNASPDDPSLKQIWKEAYSREGRTLFEGVHGLDYFLSYNGHLRVGKEMEKIDPQWEMDWNPPMFVSLEQKRFQKQCQTDFGPYVAFYFAFQGTYCHWTNQFSLESVMESVKQIAKATGLRPVFLGAVWDKEQSLPLRKVVEKLMNDDPEIVSLLGKTTVEQLFGVLKGASLVVGYPSGLTIMSAVLKQRTLVIWNDYYDRGFAWNCMPPSTRSETYFCEHTEGLTPERLAFVCSEIVAGRKPATRMPEKIKGGKSGQKKVGVRKVKSRFIPTDFAKPPQDVTVACVLRSGGDYDEQYVHKLMNALERHVTVPYQFVCLTDMEILEGANAAGVKVIVLEDGFQGWWAKVELFKPKIFNTKYTVYFDLDTIILGNIDDMFHTEFDFHALRPWNKGNQRRGIFASGMMAWENDEYSFLYAALNETEISEAGSGGDQRYLSKILSGNGHAYSPLQESIPGIYSYKRNCQHKMPPDARIVCFHGRPRPHEMTAPWVKENWK
jgi:SAM-dependent methyltransferase